MQHRPDFIMVGAAKSGTTSVYEYLRQHPAIFMPDFKEPHYFVSDKTLNFPVTKTKSEYEHLFSEAGSKVKGEASTGYLYFPESAQRIHQALPGTRIIAVVRNPVDRAFSMWGHQCRENLETLDFKLAIEMEIKNSIREVNGTEFGFNYLRLGFIAAQLTNYQYLFGHQNVFIGDYEILKRDPRKFMQSVYQFLGVDAGFNIQITRPRNVSGQPLMPVLHSFLNSKGRARELLSRPARWLLSDGRRHLIWKWLREGNIRAGRQQQMDIELRSKLQIYFKNEQIALNQLIAKQTPG